MIVTFVHVWVKENYINEFLDATIENHKNSVKEPGNLRFDILQDAENRSKFTLYEAYDSEESAAAHKETAHYLKWRETVANMMTQPRKGIKHDIVYPKEINQW
jgi:(4S)-4-hydroxy-5-phosphonooxypentane-2,3-dione isomerase